MSNSFFLRTAVCVVALALATAFIIRGQQQTKHDSGMTQQQMDELNKRGDKAMGFDHLKTTHHFRLAKDGGSIEVEAKDANDKQSRDQIRMHLSHIAMMFSDGNFRIPMLVHDENPPGADVMTKLKSEIKYQYSETERGGRVRISTANPEALQGVFDFLRYQIKEHMTGDSLDVPKQ